MTTQHVSHWLEDLGLSVYAESFRQQQIDFSLLPSLTDADLKDLGITVLGHRKRLLSAIAALDLPGSESAAGADSLSSIVSRLPTPVALALQDYRNENHPVIKLWAACDAIETLLQILVFLGIGELIRHGELPKRLRRQIGRAIETPMLGNWRRMAQQVAEALPTDSTLPRLRTTVEEVLIPFLDGTEGIKTPEQSFLALRNRLAHGGGIRSRLATELLAIWQTPFENLWQPLDWLCELDFVVRTTEGMGRLRGPSEHPKPFVPAAQNSIQAALATKETVIALHGDQVIPLWPLALYGPPRHPERDTDLQDDARPQIYVRRGEVQLEYTPLGEGAIPQSVSDDAATERFLALFRIPREVEIKQQTDFSVIGFEERFETFAKRLRGRFEERETLRRTLAETPNGVLWLEGVAGMGKSILMADLAHELLSTPRDDTLVLGYQFRANDSRCGRETFLRFVIERLEAWLKPVEEKFSENIKPLDRLNDLLARLGERRVLILVDGLDEITERDRDFVSDIPLGIKSPTLTWLCAGRPEQGLSATFAEAGAIRIFPQGLPPMQAGDIRTWLLERIGPLRKQLLRQDTEQGELIGNPFVDKIARLSEGLPLYVEHVINDIHAGRYRVFDAGEALPPGLNAYHEELLRRLSVGTLHQVLTPMAATLAIAKEPLSVLALADLLRQRGRLVPDGEPGRQLVKQGLAAIASLLRRTPTPEDEEGFTLYHHSLVQHMVESAHSRDAVSTAREFLADLAETIPTGPLAPYLFRHGITHQLEAGRIEAALGLLTRFDYLMARLQTLKNSEGVEGISTDWRTVIAHDPKQDLETRLWVSFWREREHILRRGNEHWPAYKILLQLAVEHADDSEVTLQAERWLDQGHCDWVWLRNPQRISQTAPNPCSRTFEGHRCMHHMYANVLADGRILSWSDDATLRLWDGQSGTPLATLTGHTEWVQGALLLADGRILSWSRDGTLRLWNGQTGASLATLTGHTGWVRGALILADGRILSWSTDKTLRLWDGQNGTPLATLTGHTGGVDGTRILADGCILSWSHHLDSPWRFTLRLWDGLSGSSIGNPLSEEELLQHPDLIYEFMPGIRRPSEPLGNNCLAWSLERTAGIAQRSPGVKPIVWQGPGGLSHTALHPSGIIVTSSLVHLFCLQLQHGKRHISLEEYENLSTNPNDGDCSE